MPPHSGCRARRRAGEVDREAAHAGGGASAAGVGDGQSWPSSEQWAKTPGKGSGASAARRAARRGRRGAARRGGRRAARRRGGRGGRAAGGAARRRGRAASLTASAARAGGGVDHHLASTGHDCKERRREAHREPGSEGCHSSSLSCIVAPSDLPRDCCSLRPDTRSPCPSAGKGLASQVLSKVSSASLSAVTPSMLGIRGMKGPLAGADDLGHALVALPAFAADGRLRVLVGEEGEGRAVLRRVVVAGLALLLEDREDVPGEIAGGRGLDAAACAAAARIRGGAAAVAARAVVAHAADVPPR